MNEKIIQLLSAVALNLDKELTWALVELIREVPCVQCAEARFSRDGKCAGCLGTGQKYHKSLVNFTDQEPGVVMSIVEGEIQQLKKALGKPTEKLVYRSGPK